MCLWYSLIHLLLAICGSNQLRYVETFPGLSVYALQSSVLQMAHEHLSSPVGIFMFLNTLMHLHKTVFLSVGKTGHILFISSDFLNCLKDLNPSEWDLIWTWLSPGFTHKLYSKESTLLAYWHPACQPWDQHVPLQWLSWQGQLNLHFSCRSQILTTNFKA